MKKIFALATLLVAALALTNCSKEEIVTPEVEGKNFELFASMGNTRTTMDNLVTSWANGDAMNVWTAATEGFTSHGQFTISDVANGKFEGTLNEAFDNTTANDWYALYPYNSKISAPDGSSYMYVGHSAPVQTGNNSQAHLSGSSAPLYGIAKAVAGTDTPVFQMHHLSSFVRVRVTNNTTAPFAVASVTLYSDNNYVAGSYYVDVTGDTVEYNPSGGNYTKTEVTLTVKEGEEIAVGEKAEFYLPIAPIEFTAEDLLTIDVTTVDGALVSVEKSIPANKVFAAGKMTTLNVEATADNTEHPEGFTPGRYVIYAVSGDNKAISSTANGTRLSTVANFDTSATFTTDATIVWDIEENAVLNGYTIKSLATGSYISWTSGNTAATSATEYGVIVTPQTNGSVRISSINDGSRFLGYNESSNWFAFYLTTSNQNLDLYLQPIEYREGPALTWGTEATVIEHNDTAEHTVSVTANTTDITVAAYDDEEGTVASEWLTASYADGVLTYKALSENTGSTRIAYVIATVTNEVATKTFILPISQQGGSISSYTASLSFLFSDMGSTGWSTSYTKHEVAFEEGTAIFSSANKQQATITTMPVTKGQPVEFKMTNGGTITSATLKCAKWGSKAQTITMHYSTDNGTTYTSTGVTSSTFEITNDALPSGTNALKFTFSSSSNQVGIEKLDITYTK